jgi:hypothetical protein
MIGFLQPLALLGIAAAAVPPLLHLLGRRDPPTVVFPAVRYLRATEREHSRLLRLRHRLLLLLRMALLTLLALAAARPVARVAWGGGHPPAAVALVVDNSLSSGAVVRGRRVVDELVDRARRILERLGDEDRLWLVLADGIPRPANAGAAAAVLDDLEPSSVALDLGAAVRAAAQAVSSAGATTAEVVVVSDLQASAMSPGAPSAVPVLVWEPPPVPPNRWVAGAVSEPAVWFRRGAVVAEVEGSNTERTAAALLVHGVRVAGAVVGAGERVVLEGTPPRTGWLAASVELDPDELRADDRRWIALVAAAPAAVRAGPGAGRFVAEGLAVLVEAGRAVSGGGVTLGDRPGPGTTIVFPPSDRALVGSANRALTGRGVDLRFGERVDGEWLLDGDGEGAGARVLRRHVVEGGGTVLATVDGAPWLVRSGEVIVVGSRLEQEWTDLPVRAAFLPFLDALLNRVAATDVRVVGATPLGVFETPAGAARLRVPDGPVPARGGLRATAPGEPGVYFLEDVLGDTVAALEVNVDPRESPLKPATTGGVRQTLGDDARVLGAAALDRELFGGARRAELTTWLLALALLVALTELVVASVGGTRKVAT